MTEIWDKFVQSGKIVDYLNYKGMDLQSVNSTYTLDDQVKGISQMRL